MNIIDAHAHIPEVGNYLDNLIKTLDDCDIEKCCISGLGKLFKCIDNEGIKQIFTKYPDRFIGAYFIRPGINKPEEIDSAYSSGFRMLKVTIPTKPYDAQEFFPLWEKAQDFKLPILFHTGIITLPKKLPEERVSSWFMHPMKLEPITNAFPKLKIIIAHLGVHWNEDAAELLRMRSNVYADLTGEPDGWRARMDRIGLDKFLWWPGAFKKMIFGTDVWYNKIPIILQQDIKRLDQLHIDNETRELIFSKNISKLLRI